MNEKEKEVEEVKSEVVGKEDKIGVLAIVSLVLGIVSILCCWIPFFNFVLGAVALVLGIIELRNINKGISSEKGKVMAIIGLILGGIILLWGIISIFTIGISSILRLPQMYKNWY